MNVTVTYEPRLTYYVRAAYHVWRNGERPRLEVYLAALFVTGVLAMGCYLVTHLGVLLPAAMALLVPLLLYIAMRLVAWISGAAAFRSAGALTVSITGAAVTLEAAGPDGSQASLVGEWRLGTIPIELAHLWVFQVPLRESMILVPKSALDADQAQFLDSFVSENALRAWPARRLKRAAPSIDAKLQRASQLLREDDAEACVREAEEVLDSCGPLGREPVLFARHLIADAIASRAVRAGVAHHESLVSAWNLQPHDHEPQQVADHAYFMRAQNGLLAPVEALEAKDALDWMFGGVDAKLASVASSYVTYLIVAEELDTAQDFLERLRSSSAFDSAKKAIATAESLLAEARLLSGNAEEANRLWRSAKSYQPAGDRARPLSHLSAILLDTASADHPLSFPRLMSCFGAWTDDMRSDQSRRSLVAEVLGSWTEAAYGWPGQLTPDEQWCQLLGTEVHLSLLRGDNAAALPLIDSRSATEGTHRFHTEMLSHSRALVLTRLGEVEPALSALLEARKGLPNQLPNTQLAGVTHEAARTAALLGNDDLSRRLYRDARLEHLRAQEPEYALDCERSIKLLDTGDHASPSFPSGGVLMTWAGAP